MSGRLKRELRKTYSKKRQEISLSIRQQAGLFAADCLVQENIFKESRHIACYLPFNGEFDSQPLIQKIWQADKYCYLPVLTEKKELFFVRYDKDDKLVNNKYSILEPINTSRKIAVHDLDMVLTPLIAFDGNGHRLGTGGGYYDKTFAFLKQHPFPKKPFMLGLGFAVQQAEHVPTDPWDIHLQAVLTEKGLIYCLG